jgi:hypothetical protein
MGMRGRAHVEKSFSTRRYLEGYRELFDKAKELIA